jgi:protein-S-isoprenylcysteine O-methyltransferase Ste14
MVNFPKAYADRVAKVRIAFNFLLVGAFAWFSHPSMQSLAVGLPVSFCGLALRAWAAGNLAKDARLARSGPYAYLRNPLYMGTLVVAAGLVIASQSLGLGILFALAFGLIYLPVIQLEEQHLRSLFPDYAEYAQEVPALVPRIRRTTQGAAFRLQLYLKNREYEALAGFLAGTALLVWKSW